ncbi:MAG: transcription termination/antitermination protein NusG [Liquorilactobacillus hordei]|uniref:Transcription termination/antitermination protein NusG n=2 Tax=Liquorilactobacillus hordei TaxID=468911 RepID=A0A0R1MEM3_9LACO|nr:transcription termination/antitermination protein NusG [Liquorilactobacillus hordei]AUJ29222.1 transcription termination/antitermination protein NusG [Liquorilactobacillus hordei]KRL06542.1 transcription antitermination protein NusG [Liquorilactobacillus hordei DSM 19519]MBZ2405535.1 transcription termination/antitermination protein NusG [Liquorilactobacillus hordei]QYH51935.1 transcription termination/antitermination protein NusG [Liquorilactobacillus hordei DSM 19519]
MPESFEKNWYVLHTYSGYENKVRTNLESRAQSMGMEDYIFRVVVPEEEETETTKSGKDKIETKKTFPGYVLVEMVMTDRSWYVARNTPGVTGFVGSHGAGSKPAPLLSDEVELILRRLGMSSRHQDFDVEVGESVTIIEGAFKGLVGKITEVDKEKMKLRVNIDMFGRETATELNYDQVDKLI